MSLDPGSLHFRRTGGWWLSCRLLACGLIFVCGGTCLAEQPADSELQQALDTIVAVRPGTETEPVAAAWNIVARASYEQLPLVLQAVDKADGLSANWISMALDRIVQQQGVEQLPREVLRNNALNTKHTLLTRKMALELLGRADEKLVDALQPELMNDPESELRRPAIETAMAQASDLGTQDASPVARDGVVFMPSRGLTALKFDASADEPTLLWQENRLGAQRGSPVVDEGKLFVIRSSNILACGDAATGEPLWNIRLKGSQFWATPIVAGDHVYAASAEGLVQVINIAGEKPEIVARNDMQEEMLGSPAISDGAICLRGVSSLWKIGP